TPAARPMDSFSTTDAGALVAGAWTFWAGAFAPAPFSTVKMTCPTLSLSPSLTRISFTTPLTDEGTSMTALSVSSSMTGWPSFTSAPGAIIRRTKSPCSMFSPSSGSLNSVTVLEPFLADGRVRLFGIDAQIVHGLLHGFDLDLVFASERAQSCEHDVLGIDFEEVTKRGTILAPAQAVGTKRNEPPRTPASDALG